MIRLWVGWGNAIPGSGKSLHFSPNFLCLHWAPIKPAIECIPGSFLGGQSSWGTAVTTHLRLTQRLKFVELYFHSSVCLHGVYRSKFTFTINFFHKSELVDIIGNCSCGLVVAECLYRGYFEWASGYNSCHSYRYRLFLCHNIFIVTFKHWGTWWHGWHTAVLAGRLWIQFLLLSLVFFIDKILWPNYSPGINSASNRNED